MVVERVRQRRHVHEHVEVPAERAPRLRQIGGLRLVPDRADAAGQRPRDQLQQPPDLGVLDYLSAQRDELVDVLVRDGKIEQDLGQVVVVRERDVELRRVLGLEVAQPAVECPVGAQ